MSLANCMRSISRLRNVFTEENALIDNHDFRGIEVLAPHKAALWDQLNNNLSTLQSDSLLELLLPDLQDLSSEGVSNATRLKGALAMIKGLEIRLDVSQKNSLIDVGSNDN